MSDQIIRTKFELSSQELDALKDQLRNIHEINQLQRLKNSNLRQAQQRNIRMRHLEQAIKDGKLTGKIPQLWPDEAAKEALHWLLRNFQYKTTRHVQSAAAMPKSLQPSSSVSELQSENPATKTPIISATSHQLSLLSSLHRPPQTQTETRLSATETPSPVPSQLALSREHGVKRSFWFAKSDSQHPRSPAAAELYRVFLVTKNTVTQKIWPVMVSDLPSHGIDGTLSYADWSEWLRLLTEHCEFNNKIQQIQTSDAVYTITDYRVWRTVILMSLEITGSLQFHFSIVESSLESEHLNTSGGLDNPAINSTLLTDDDISDASSTNTRPSKRLRSNTTEKGSVPDLPADTSGKSPIPTTPIFQQRLIDTSDVSSTDNTRPPKELYSTTVKENPAPDFPANISDQTSVSTTPVPQQPSTITPLIDTTHEKQDDTISVHSSSLGEDKNMQHDVPDDENIDKIITRDKIATEDDLKGDEVGPSHAIHTATKKCEQFSNERWQNFQKFFMLPKEGNDGTDPYRPIPFPGLERWPFPHQLYAALIMLIKASGSGGGGFLGDEMGVGKTMTVLMFFILNAWLIDNERSVEQDRSQPEQSPRKHLPEDAPESASCPSQAQWPFLCRCVNSPFSAKQFEPREGATLVIAPKSLLLAWTRQWAETVPNGENKRNIMKFQLLIGHGEINNRVLDKIGHPDIHVIAEQQSHIQAEDDLTSRFNDHRYLVVTTPLSFVSKVHPHTDKPNTNTRRNFFNDATILARMNWGSIIRDEFHSEKGRESTTVKVFRQLTLRQDQALLPTWLLSGTIFDKGPIDIQHWMTVLETVEWDQHPSLKEATAKPYKELSTQVQKLVNKPSPLLQSEKKDMEDLATKFSSILEELAICRAAESTWFGKPVLKLPPHKHFDYVCKIPEKYHPYFKELEENMIQSVKLSYWRNFDSWRRKKSEPKPQISTESFFKRSLIVRIGAIFPAILPLVKQHGLQLTGEEFKQKKWNSENNPAPYFNKLDELIQSSAKCKVIEDILEQMADSTNFAGQEEKLVIFTNSPVVARILAKVSATHSYT